jgi:predicted transcriptional regulator
MKRLEPMTSHVVSLRITDEMKDRLDRLSSATQRSPAALAEEALDGYLSQQELELDALAVAVEKADSGRFVSHDAAAAWLRSWGTAEEQPAPVPDIFKTPR